MASETLGAYALAGLTAPTRLPCERALNSKGRSNTSSTAASWIANSKEAGLFVLFTLDPAAGYKASPAFAD